MNQDLNSNTSNNTVVICSMVRDCAKEIRHNIPAIEFIVSKFRDYRIVVFENNSLDNTKDVLRQWSTNNNKVVLSLNDFDESVYNDIEIDYSSLPPFRRSRIQKYVDYRNKLLDLVDSIGFESDYTIMVDMDVAHIEVQGVLSSFQTDVEWDAITANGYSRSICLKRRFHDTYPLCEYGSQNIVQNKDQLYKYRRTFGKLRKGMLLVRVFSAYGGLTIYKSEAIKDLRYKLLYNNYGGIEVRCEHFSLFVQMADKGFDKVYINPDMEILYQKINLKSICRFIKNKFRR